MHRIQRLLLSRQLSNAVTATNTKPAVVDPDLATAKPFDDIPGIKTFWDSLKAAIEFLPFIGKYYYEPIRLHDIHLEAYKTFGKLYRLNGFGGFQVVMVFDPDDIKKAFKYEGKYPKRVMLEAFKLHRDLNAKEYCNSGILMENGVTWRNTRFKVQKPMLQSITLAEYIPRMVKISTEFIERMKYLRDDKGEVPDYLQELYKWALESVSLVAFNVRLGCLDPNITQDSESERMLQAVSESFEIATETEFGPKLWKLYSPLSKSYRRIAPNQSYIRSVAKKYVEQTIQQMKSEKEADDSSSAEGILRFVLKQGLDPREVVTFTMDLLTAGVDTTSHSFGCLLYLLARNPDKQEILYQHIQKELSSSSEVTSSTLDALPYLRGCIKESMRLMSAVVGTNRVYQHDIALGGYRIPAGTVVVVLPQVSAIMPEYFEDPNDFKPERWLPGGTKYHSFSNLPFGYGPRGCIGRRLAMQEMQLLLIKILENFRIEYHYEDINLKARFVMMPDKPLKFTFVDRK